MWLRVHNERRSPFAHPIAEVHVDIKLADDEFGPAFESVVVDRRSIKEGCIDIGYPVGYRDDEVLVDLGRETDMGHHRVWVPRSEVFGWEALGTTGADVDDQMELPLEPTREDQNTNSGPNSG